MRTNELRGIVCAISLAVFASMCALRAQDTNALVLTNGMSQVDDATGADVSQAADTAPEEDLAGTNTVADTNQIASPGLDGRARRRIRQAQNRPRANAQPNGDSRANSAGTNSGTSGLDYSAFRLVVERNIFDPNRFPRAHPTAPPKTVDAFTLVGTMSYEKGIFAFFDGTSSDYKKALKPDENIAGYKVVAISADSAKLMLNTNLVELSIGAQMRRRDDGTWERSSTTYAPSPASSTSSSPGDSASSGGAESDVLKKMMLRREKE